MKISASGISIMLNSPNYTGDNSADIEIPLTNIPGETIEQLVKRAGLDYKEYIAIRVVLDSIVEG